MRQSGQMQTMGSSTVHNDTCRSVFATLVAQSQPKTNATQNSELIARHKMLWPLDRNASSGATVKLKSVQTHAKRKRMQWVFRLW